MIYDRWRITHDRKEVLVSAIGNTR